MKQEFGGSGRDVRFGAGPLTGPLANWAANRLAAGPLFAEPWVRFEAEFSAHFTLTGDAAIFEGTCRLRSTPAGQFEAVEPTTLTPPLAAALPVWEAVAGQALAAGYRGPLGIDAGFAGGRVVRPVMDANARWDDGSRGVGDGAGSGGTRCEPPKPRSRKTSALGGGSGGHPQRTVQFRLPRNVQVEQGEDVLRLPAERLFLAVRLAEDRLEDVPLLLEHLVDAFLDGVGTDVFVTTTLFFTPTRCARLIAWSSIAGFHQRSYRKT